MQWREIFQYSAGKYHLFKKFLGVCNKPLPFFVIVYERYLLVFYQGDDGLEDSMIVELFVNRDEEAIRQCEAKYGAELKRMSLRIVGSEEDACECLNDTLLQAWNSITEQKDYNLRAYLIKLVRNTSINCLKKKTAAKRGAVNIALDELEGCLPDNRSNLDFIEKQSLTHEIEDWLLTLSAEKKAIFVRRYFLMESAKEIAAELSLKEGTVLVILSRLRKSLAKHLREKEYILP